jgi:hypothetical protein
MTDFASGEAGWKAWKGPKHSARRKEFTDALSDCIKRHTNKGFSVSLQRRDYLEANRVYQLAESAGGPYAMVGMACLAELVRNALIKRKHEKSPEIAEKTEKSFDKLSEVVQLNAVIDAAILEKLCAANRVPRRKVSPKDRS